MSGAAEHGQKKSAIGSKESYPSRVFAQEALSDLDEKIHSSGGLQDTRRGYSGDNDVDNSCGGGAWLHLEDEYQNSKTDAGYDTEGDPAPSCAIIEAGKDKEQLYYWEHDCTSIK